MGTKFERILALIQDAPGLDEHERILFARSLAATPAQRWRIHNNVLRSLVFSWPSVWACVGATKRKPSVTFTA